MATTLEPCPEPEAAQNSLSVTDNRTGRSFNFPIERDAVRAADFKQGKSEPIKSSMLMH